MEASSSPSSMQNRAYYKMGLLVYDNAKVVLVLTLLLCAGLGSLMTLEPKYAEGYGEGDLESVHGWEAVRMGFTSENETEKMSFYVLFHHPSGESGDEAVREAMLAMVAVLDGR